MFNNKSLVFRNYYKEILDKNYNKINLSEHFNNYGEFNIFINN